LTTARAATVALSLLVSPAAAAEGGSPLGEWLTDEKDARVLIELCADVPDRLCGRITWSARPPDAPPGPLLDRNNDDPALRSRPIEGLKLLAGFAPDGSGGWTGGTIYDPRSGKTYKSKLRLRSPDELAVSGCILFLCASEAWTRHAL
jgi:uncharacterized protein (DUF2147 family)